MQSELYSFILPAFNEEHRLPSTLYHLLALADEKNWRIEILAVDDGSTDATASVIKRLQNVVPQLRYVGIPHRLGKGNAVREGVRQARGNAIFFCDSDLASGVREVIKIEAALRLGAQVVIGNRNSPDSSFTRCSRWRQVGSTMFRSWTRLMLPLQIVDTQCGLKAFEADAARLLFSRQTLTGWAFDAELLAIARANRLTITEVGICITDHPKSRFRLVPDGIRCFADVIEIRGNLLSGAYRQSAPALATEVISEVEEAA